MKQELATSLPATGGGSLPTLSSDTRQLSLLNGMDTPAKSLENEQQTDGSLVCECGKGTLDCLIHPSTPESWTAFMQVSLALTLAMPELKQELAQKRAVASTVKSFASLAWYDPNSCSLKTSQQSLVEDLKPSLLTLPRSGMTRNGYVYELPIVGRITKETGGGYLPTPTAHNWKEGAYPAEGTRNTPTLAWVLGGRINPQYTEWLMGWPINHTALKA